MSDLAEWIPSGAGTPSPRREAKESCPNSSARRIDITVESTIDSLFAVGLTIAAARALVDGQAGVRLDQAVDALDAMIAELRSPTT